MWIRTQRNILLNSDFIEFMMYNADTDTTQAYVHGGASFVTLSSGDITERIATALSRNTNYIEVKNCG